MNKVIKVVLLMILLISITSCHKSSVDDYYIRGYEMQYYLDVLQINTFLETHKMSVDANYNVTFDTLISGTSDISIKDQTTYPLIDTLIIQDGVNYHVKYIKFREGTQKRPTVVDSVYISYKGINVNRKVFDIAPNPVWFKLDGVISGWTNFIPQFKSGTSTSTVGQPTAFDNFGAGVVFLPSGMAYFNQSAGNAGAYAPLIFTFKLCDVRYRDQDRDKILDKDERDLINNITISSNGIEITNPLQRWVLRPQDYDTDSDGYPNYIDADDDNDHYLTRGEIIDHTVVTPTTYLPFSVIPDCSGDTTNPSRLKKHLNPFCH